MKKVFISCMVFIASITAIAAGKATPMNVVEKTSYQLAGLVSKGKIDASYLTDVTHLAIANDDKGGFQVTLFSPSADTQFMNSLVIDFDPNGKAIAANAHFISSYPQGPVFANANVATMLDLGAEAIVDHLSESADNVTVAQNAQSIELQNEANGSVMLITLSTGQVYAIHMDQDGKVISQGF